MRLLDIILLAWSGCISFYLLNPAFKLMVDALL